MNHETFVVIDQSIGEAQSKITHALERALTETAPEETLPVRNHLQNAHYHLEKALAELRSIEG